MTNQPWRPEPKHPTAFTHLVVHTSRQYCSNLDTRICGVFVESHVEIKVNGIPCLPSITDPGVTGLFWRWMQHLLSPLIRELTWSPRPFQDDRKQPCKNNFSQLPWVQHVDWYGPSNWSQSTTTYSSLWTLLLNREACETWLKTETKKARSTSGLSVFSGTVSTLKLPCFHLKIKKRNLTSVTSEMTFFELPNAESLVGHSAHISNNLKAICNT